MNQPPYGQGQWTISVRDVDKGEQIVSLNADTLFEPGSVVKTYSTGAACNRITPNNQVQLQTIMAKRPDAEARRGTLPVLGVDDSLAMVEADGPAKGTVVGKTGTLLAIDGFHDRYRLAAKALGSCIDTEGERHLAFAVIRENSPCPNVNGSSQPTTTSAKSSRPSSNEPRRTRTRRAE